MPDDELSWSQTIQRVHERANYLCEYCQTSQLITAQAMHVDHIDPNGDDSLTNLALSCASCNMSKSDVVEALGTQTGEVTPLFNPRMQDWYQHFVWIEDGLLLKGLTPTGRVTIERLRMNRERVVRSRRLWILSGWHPPQVD